ncbi:MAG: DUF1223 domain-containing protein [Sphingomonadaceae bacterium]
MYRWIFAVLAGAPLVAAQGCTLQSPAHRVALLELFTSEGCSSCPPADQFVSGLRAAGVGAGQAVILSEHVDYWNAIGWKDPYSRALFSERQRWLSDLAGSRTIYTPELFVSGRELRGWAGGVPAAVQRVNATPAQADIRITLERAHADGVGVTVQANARQDARLYVALIEQGVSSQVRAGENKGRLLRHDFVVREWLSPLALVAAGSTGHLAASVTRTLAVPPGALPARLGIAAFVQTSKGEVLQALELASCDG